MNFPMLSIGHLSTREQRSGLSVFLFERPARAAYYLCGNAPATREVHLLDNAAEVQYIDALLWIGGSAYGLEAAGGVMQWLAEQGRGYPTSFLPVPIVPSASLYDFKEKHLFIPNAEQAYQACQNALPNNESRGSIGAGTAASVGKWSQTGNPMPGGIGWSQIDMPEGLKILAFAAVNSLGNIIDNQGNTLAGACDSAGNLLDIRQAEFGQGLQAGTNTTLCAVFTNAFFERPALTRIARMASSGMSRAIYPVFTRFDGDILFTVSLGYYQADEVLVGYWAALAVQQAILRSLPNSI